MTDWGYFLIQVVNKALRMAGLDGDTDGPKRGRIWYRILDYPESANMYLEFKNDTLVITLQPVDSESLNPTRRSKEVRIGIDKLANLKLNSLARFIKNSVLSYLQ